jgi:D-alanyl-D-alanine-carboxypeptidase/D-alanyl-D-alanine-endopeptidase
MKIHPVLKWGLVAVALFFSILGGVFVWALTYVLHKQHAYAAISDTNDLKAQIQKMGEDYLAGHKNAALVIAFYQRGQESVQGFGKISDSNQSAPDARTIFEIGSVTKIFTATLLAGMVNAGVAGLNDPISLYLPKDVKSPALNGREITLVDLATHTSGLPRLPGNLLATAKDQSDPYANYTTSDLYDSLRTVKLKSEPGKKSDYSNYGYGLLGKLLEVKSGKSYEALIQEKICAPLNLDSTTTQLSQEQSTRLTPGHSSDDKVTSNWHFDSLAGCGAIRSDAADLLKFIQAELTPGDSEISKALKTTQKTYYEGFTGNIGLGWQITETFENLTVLWHNGGTGGYRSFVGFDKNNQTGVVILSNYGDAMAGDSSVDTMGMQLLKIGSKVSL